MSLSALQSAKLAAKSNFKLKDLKFVEIYNVSEKFASTNGEEIDIWASLAISYEGTPPDSYRVLNSMIMDFTEDKKEDLGKVLALPLKSFMSERFPAVDLSELDKDVSDFIFEEQVDFLPEIEEDSKDILFQIELIVEVEESEEDIKDDPESV